MTRSLRFSMLLLLSAVLGLGCGEDRPADRGPRIVSFEASPSFLADPGEVRLSWTTRDATSVAISQDGTPLDLGGAGAAEGGVEVRLEATSTFELIASGREGAPARRSLTVVVGGGPSIGSLSAPEAVVPDEDGIGRATIRWTGVVGASSLRLEADPGETQALPASDMPDGEIEVELSEDTTFTLVAAGEGREAREEVSIRLATEPIILRLVAERSRIGPAESVTVEWETLGASRVELWVDGVRADEVDGAETSGEAELVLLFDAEIELRAFNAHGDETRQAITVTVGPPLIHVFTASAERIWLGDEVELGWETEGASELVLTADGVEICSAESYGAMEASTCVWAPVEAAVYEIVLTVRNAATTTEETMEIAAQVGAVIYAFEASPEAVDVGGEVKLSWRVGPDPNGAFPTLSLEDDLGGSHSISQDEEGSITLTAAQLGTWGFVLRAETATAGSQPVEAPASVEVVAEPEVHLSASPSTFDDSIAEHVLLSWETAGVRSLKLYRLETGGLVEIASIAEEEVAAGSYPVTPAELTTYRLVGTSPSGTSAQDEVRVDVAPMDILLFEAEPAAVTAGQPVTLRWVTRMSESISLDLFDLPYLPEETEAGFEDIRAQGATPLILGGGCAPGADRVCAFLPFPDGFRFPYGRSERDGLFVFGHGVVSFGFSGSVSGDPASNVDLPSEERAWAHLAPFWDELTWDPLRYPAGNVFFLYREDPSDEDALIVQWDRSQLVADPDAQLSFQLVLWEGGDFEFRYGPMLAGSRQEGNLHNGASATIGYQLPDGSAAHVRAFDGRVGIRGALSGRTFTYRRPPSSLEKSGSFVWRPSSHLESAAANLEIRKGAEVQSERVNVEIALRPEVELFPRFPEPVLIGEGLQLSWRSFHATALEVVDQEGAVRCAAANQQEVGEGACELREEREGRHEYEVRAVGAHGFVHRTPLTVFFTQPFGIRSFAADRTQINAGEEVTFTWEVEHAASVELLANGVPVHQEIDPGETGSFVATGISGETLFTFRVASPFGLVEEALVLVELWTVSLEIQPSTIRARPGEPITIDITATSLEGGPAPQVFGTLPLVEVTDPAVRYADVRDEPGVSALQFNQASTQAMINLDFPEGFRFPYFGEEHPSIRVFLDGYVSFDLAASTATTNQLLPIPSNLTQAFYRGVALAPFWDDLHPRTIGEIHAGLLGPDTFVVQWSKMSTTAGSTNQAPLNLNFQLVLFRDGSFEYRYGPMVHHLPPVTGAACNPTTCENEVNGSSATIGYQSRDASFGYMLHFGGSSGGIVASSPVPGGLSNRTFRYEPLVGGGTVSLTPQRSGRYGFCVDSAGSVLCKSIDVEAEFGVKEFKASKELLQFGEQVILSWETEGATQLTIWDGEDARFTTSDLAVVDRGTTSLSVAKNTQFILEIKGGIRAATASAPVEVERISLTAAAPAQIEIGQKVALSWTLQKHDPALDPVVIRPLEEDPSLRFTDLDLRLDPEAERLIRDGMDNEIVTVEFRAFSFRYLGREYSSMRVSTDGYISFDLGTANLTNNVTIPTDNANNRRVHLAPFWDDLHSGTYGQVLGKQIDADRYVVQWSSMRLKPEEANLNFMVVLHRNGDFEFRYGAMVPPEEPGSCFPQSCVNEVNGSSATIGYQDPTGRVGHLLHFGGSGRAPGQTGVQGGLSHRSWMFTAESGAGAVQIEPAETQLYRICALDPVHGDIFCADPVEVEVPSWGILSFEPVPEAPRPGELLELHWSLRAAEGLRLLANGVEIGSWSEPGLPLIGSATHAPTENTTYELQATSLGRVQSVERLVQLRTFSLTVTGPSGVQMPGVRVELSWSVTGDDPGEVWVTSPMREIPAGPGQPGAFVDISDAPGAERLQLPFANGTARLRLPFDPFGFPYFGQTYDEVVVFATGYISLETAVTFGNVLNVPLPVADGVQPMHLAPFWDSLSLVGDAEIWAHSPSPGVMVIQWTRFTRTEGSETPAGRFNLNFQLVLFEDGAFEYRYGRMDPPAAPYYNPAVCSPGTCEREASGSSATIGYQTIDNRYGYTAHFGGVEKSPEIQASTGAGGGAFLAFPGGLSNRSFRFEPGRSGTAEVMVGRTREHEICAFSATFSECKPVRIQAAADPGELAITELMIAPAGGAQRQWFEVRNLTKRPIDLEGFELRTASGSHVIQGSLVVDPGGFATFAATEEAGIGASYHYGTGLPLGQVSDQLELRAGAAIIASVDWGIDWEIPTGQSLSLDPSFQIEGNDHRWLFREWCLGGASGSPGTLGLGCRSSFYDVDPSSDRAFIDISSIGGRLYEAEATGGMAPLPGEGFPGAFFGAPIDRIWVSANGWLSVAEERPSPTSAVPFVLPRGPTDGSARATVGAFWDSLQCDRRAFDCKVHYFQGELGGQEVTIVQWSGFRHSFGPGSITFQVQLWADRDIVVAFDEARSDSPEGSRGYLSFRGNGAWVGLEGWQREDFLTGHQMSDADFNGRSFHFMAK